MSLIAGRRLLYRYEVKGAERIEQEDKAQDNSNDIERLAFDEHAYDVKDEIEDESCDKE
jgi:hypothetical protein